MTLSKQPSEEVNKWALPSFGSTSGTDVDVTQVKAMTAGDLEKLQQQVMAEASEKGFQEGLEKGLKLGESQVQKKIQQLSAIMVAIGEPFKDLDEQVENEIAALAINIAKHVIRREIKTDSGQVVGIVKEALAALPSSSQNIQLFLHPDDAELVKSSLSLDSVDQARWAVISDPVISPGGCRVITDASTIDATVEKRLSTIIIQALGDERGLA